jgi:hypothetical protein
LRERGFRTVIVDLGAEFEMQNDVEPLSAFSSTAGQERDENTLVLSKESGLRSVLG